MKRITNSEIERALHRISFLCQFKQYNYHLLPYNVCVNDITTETRMVHRYIRRYVAVWLNRNDDTTDKPPLEILPDARSRPSELLKKKLQKDTTHFKTKAQESRKTDRRILFNSGFCLIVTRRFSLFEEKRKSRTGKLLGHILNGIFAEKQQQIHSCKIEKIFR